MSAPRGGLIVHAGLVAQRLAGRWRGALIEGASGAGKSDLALRCLDAGLQLVADDRVVLWASDVRLFGRAPEPLEGLIEARGLGILQTPAVPFCEVVLVVRPGEPERLPDPTSVQLAGFELPLCILTYAEASAPVKLGRALAALYVGGQRRI